MLLTTTNMVFVRFHATKQNYFFIKIIETKALQARVAQSQSPSFILSVQSAAGYKHDT